MTLTETLARISESENCDQTAALNELTKLLADGIFRQPEIRWEDPVSRPFGSSGGIAIPDDTPVCVDWKKARFRLRGDGEVLDSWTGYKRTKKGNPRWRKLLLLRERVEKQWPLNSGPASPNEKASGSKVLAFDQKKRSGPIPTESKIVDAAKHLFTQDLIPAQTCDWESFRVKLCEKLGVHIDTRGYGLDTVQNVVRPLLKQHSGTERTENTEN